MSTCAECGALLIWREPTRPGGLPVPQCIPCQLKEQHPAGAALLGCSDDDTRAMFHRLTRYRCLVKDCRHIDSWANSVWGEGAAMLEWELPERSL